MSMGMEVDMEETVHQELPANFDDFDQTLLRWRDEASEEGHYMCRVPALEAGRSKELKKRLEANKVTLVNIKVTPHNNTTAILSTSPRPVGEGIKLYGTRPVGWESVAGLPLARRKPVAGKYHDASEEQMTRAFMKEERSIWARIMKEGYSLYSVAGLEDSLLGEHPEADEPTQIFSLRDIMWELADMGVGLPSLSDSQLRYSTTGEVTPWEMNVLDLGLIIVNRLGAPIIIYSVEPERRDDFERILSETCKDKYKECPHFLHHSNIITDPVNDDEPNNKKLVELVTKQTLLNQDAICLAPGTWYMTLSLGFSLREVKSYGYSDWSETGAEANTCEHNSRYREWLQMGQLLDLYASEYFEDSDEEDETGEKVEPIRESNFVFIRDRTLPLKQSTRP